MLLCLTKTLTAEMSYVEIWNVNMRKSSRPQALTPVYFLAVARSEGWIKTRLQL